MYALHGPETFVVDSLEVGIAIEARGVIKEFGELDDRTRVLEGIDLAILRGEMAAITGSTGSGKSTLLACLSGLENVSGGQILINEKNITGMREKALAIMRNRTIGFVFQHFNLIGSLTAQENVELSIMLGSGFDQNPRDRAGELLELVGLSHCLQHLPAELSRGEQKRVAVARALANDPDILFADDPTGNLDWRSEATILDLLLDLNQRFKKTLVIVTHNPDIACHCDRILHLESGRIVSTSQSYAFRERASA